MAKRSGTGSRHHDDTSLWLISAGADVQRRYRHGNDAVQVAAMSAGPAVLRALLDSGASACGSSHGDNALTKAIRQGRPAEVVQMLVDAGADVNWQPAGRPRPLTLAVELGRTDLIGILERAGGQTGSR